jgi:hypothetical protein
MNECLYQREKRKAKEEKASTGRGEMVMGPNIHM